MHLLEQYVIEERSEIMRQQIRFTTIGRRDGLGKGVLAEVDRTIEFSRPNTGMGLCLALNYRRAVGNCRRGSRDCPQGRVRPDGSR